MPIPEDRIRAIEAELENIQRSIHFNQTIEFFSWILIFLLSIGFIYLAVTKTYYVHREDPKKGMKLKRETDLRYFAVFFVLYILALTYRLW